MTTANKPIDRLVYELQERTKELNCLYKIEERLNDDDVSFEQKLTDVVNAIPPGWQYPSVCAASLTYLDQNYQTPNYADVDWRLVQPIVVQEKRVGEIVVVYIEEMPQADVGPFLEEEVKLLRTIVDRLAHYILYQNLKTVFHDLQRVRDRITRSSIAEWRIAADMLRKTDPSLFMRILRKLLHELCWKGVEEAELLLRQSSIELKDAEGAAADENRPLKKKLINNYDEYIDAILSLANEYLNDDEILAKMQMWIKQDKSGSLIRSLESASTSLSDISEAIRKFYHMAPEKVELSPSTIKNMRVSLLRRFFTEDLNYISIAKDYVKLTDFYNLIDKMIFLPASHGKLGGKSSGVFLAQHILGKSASLLDAEFPIKVPRTWHLTSDCVLEFIQYNNLEEVLEMKYKDIDEVRLTYPHTVQVFKNSEFPPDIVKGLSVMLDDFGHNPIVVRSSSLLEDQVGAAFSGKYKSLFLANQGTKRERLAELTDAIAEVYASTFCPDAIEYRAERGLLDFHEEMGIMVMEVVGNRIGKYFMPSFAGVAFSNNEFRWSPRIKREDGLVRLVPGLGTRAVDRLGDDYPTLIAPGRPNLRVNIDPEAQARYSPKKADVINLETNRFETVDVLDIIRDYGERYPGVENVVSLYENGMLRRPSLFDVDFENDDLFVTFEGLRNETSFVKQIHEILRALQEKFNSPVDIEFASDGKCLYLLQCRPQSYSTRDVGDEIPSDTPKERTLFTANRFVSNGRMPEISHIVYVDPDEYGKIEDRKTLDMVGEAVGRLNNMLPKRKFILMGPGRWGSRGDVKLGVNVKYSDINNTAMLVEIARKKGGYVPDLSFGTHFFQDLVEARIRYLPLYPDDEGTFFNDEFFTKTRDAFARLLPEYEEAGVGKAVKVIDVQEETDGLILRVLLNAEDERALGLLAPPDAAADDADLPETIRHTPVSGGSRDREEEWKWRYRMAARLAARVDADKYGIKGMYIFGSSKNAIARNDSDIDLIIHVDGDPEKRREAELWFDGWSKCLAEINFLRNGTFFEEGILDCYFVTDEDVENRNSYAMKIGAPTNPAKPLQLKRKKSNSDKDETA
jgi:hypothetical protein